MVGIVEQEDGAQTEQQAEGGAADRGLARPRTEWRFGRPGFLGQPDDVHGLRFRDAGFFHAGDDGLLDFLVSLDVALEFVVADQFAVQFERHLFLLPQRGLEVFLAVDQHFEAAFQGENGVGAGLLELLLEPVFEFEGLLEIGMLGAIALLQHGQFAAMVLEPLERGLHRQFAEQRRDLGRFHARIDLRLDGLPEGFGLDAFRLGRGQRGIQRLEFFDDDVLVFFKRNRPGGFAVFLEFQQALFQLLAVFLRTRPQPLDGFHGRVHAHFQILLDIGAGQRVGQIAGELRIGMFHGKVDHPAFLDRRDGDPLAGDLRFLLGRPAGQEIRAGRQPALLQRRGHHLAAVEGVDVGVEVFQVPGVVGQDVLVVQDLGNLRLDEQRGGAAVIGHLAPGLQEKEEEDGDEDQQAQPGALHDDGHAFAPVGELREAGLAHFGFARDKGSFVHRLFRASIVRRTPAGP